MTLSDIFYIFRHSIIQVYGDYIIGFLQSIYAMDTFSSLFSSPWGCDDLYILGHLLFIFHCRILSFLSEIVHHIQASNRFLLKSVRSVFYTLYVGTSVYSCRGWSLIRGFYGSGWFSSNSVIKVYLLLGIYSLLDPVCHRKTWNFKNENPCIPSWSGVFHFFLTCVLLEAILGVRTPQSLLWIFGIIISGCLSFRPFCSFCSHISLQNCFASDCWLTLTCW